MSKENVKQMFGKMEKDAVLKGKYAELMKAHQIETEKALADKLVEFGKTAGFKFSNENLMAARSELADKINENKELTDGDLANVAGGEGIGRTTGSKSNAVIFSIITAGIYCLERSISMEANYKGGCGDILSATCGK